MKNGFKVSAPPALSASPARNKGQGGGGGGADLSAIALAKAEYVAIVAGVARNFFLSILLLASGVLHAQTEPEEFGVVVESTVPKEFFLGAGGQQMPLMLRGKNLDRIRAIRVFTEEDKPIEEILGRPGFRHPTIRRAFFFAAPNIPPYENYKVLAITADRSYVPVPVLLRIVSPDDPRAQPPTLEQLASGEGNFATDVLSVDPELVPRVTATEPDPLHVLNDGELKQIILRGDNLDKVKEVRLRLATKPPSYTKKSGLMAFELTDGAIELEVSAHPSIEPGTGYALDLIVGKFIADTVFFDVKSASQD